MGFLRALGKNFWRFMVIFSFIVNIILVIVLLVAGILIFEIKNQIAQPLVTGLHSSFVGLDQATIDWTIPVRDQIPVVLNIPLETDTIVTLTQPVPLQVQAEIDLPGINAYNVAASVRLDLPAGLQLPVALDLDVAVDQPLDVALDVRAVIPLQETQLHDVAENLRLLFEPLAVGLTNLPNGFDEVPEFAGDLLGGDVNLLAANEYSQQPWPGYSTTAGLGYELYTEAFPPQNVPAETGIVPIGGIPALDEQIRPDVYVVGSPEEVNAQAIQNLNARNVPSYFYDGGIGRFMRERRSISFEQVNTGGETSVVDDQGIMTGEATGGATEDQGVGGDLGIIPTPANP